MDMNFHSVKRIHFVGIKGIAMAALSVWAKERGIAVTGSDVEEEFPSDPILREVNIVPFVGFDASHIAQAKPDIVIYTGAHHGRDNPEVIEARRLGIPAFPHGKALGYAMAGKRQISVAGSHGKTTTSAMIAAILREAGGDPSYAVGSGVIGGLGFPGHFGKGDFFVAEADEYVTDPTHDATPRFLWQTPEILVVTNIDFDHPDVYPTLAAVKKAFLKLQMNQPPKGITVVNADDPASEILRKNSSRIVLTYGRNQRADFRIIDEQFSAGASTFTLMHNEKDPISIRLQVPGAHNIANAAAACVSAFVLGVPWEISKRALAAFGGAKRRFEKLGQTDTMTFYDDYAHHPREIIATLTAARLWYPKETIIAVFQAHTYSRTKALFSQFGRAFENADIVLCTDIYASARERDTHEITGGMLCEEIRKNHQHVFFTPGKEDVISFLQNVQEKHSVVVFMGAGSIYSWEKDTIDRLRSRI